MVYLANRTSPAGSSCSSACARPRWRRPAWRGALPRAQPGRRRRRQHARRPPPGLARRRAAHAATCGHPHRAARSATRPRTSNPLPGNHGGPQTRDNFFAVAGGAFVRQGMPPGSAEPLFDDTLVNPLQAENVDPAPTVMGLLGLAAPRDNAGRFLGEAFDLAACPGAGCRRAGRPCACAGPASASRAGGCARARPAGATAPGACACGSPSARARAATWCRCAGAAGASAPSPATASGPCWPTGLAQAAVCGFAPG